MRILLVLIMMLISVQAAHAVSLRQSGMIDDTTIKLGDIFEGTYDKAERVLGPAPLPGKDMVLNARTLMRIAMAMDLNWRPQTSGEYIVLKRAATIVSQDTIEDALRTELSEKGVNGKFTIQYDQLPDTIVLPQNEDEAIEIQTISYRPERQWFQATLMAPSRDNPLYTGTISGQIHRLVEIPVLKNTLRHGSIIGVRDIEFIEIKDRNIQSGMIVHGEDLVGMTPRSVITPGIPVKTVDVEEPQIVARGELVTMIFKHGPLILTAQGKALENGAEGDYIRIVNTTSNKTVQARVTGDNEVTLENF